VSSGLSPNGKIIRDSPTVSLDLPSLYRTRFAILPVIGSLFSHFANSSRSATLGQLVKTCSINRVEIGAWWSNSNRTSRNLSGFLEEMRACQTISSATGKCHLLIRRSPRVFDWRICAKALISRQRPSRAAALLSPRARYLPPTTAPPDHHKL
jgi:hypothetical protein